MNRKITCCILLFILLLTGCSSNETEETSIADTEETSIAVTEETSVSDSEKDSAYPLTVYETCEVTEETSDFMYIVLPNLTTPYALEDMDAIGGPYYFRAYTDIDGLLEREFFTEESLADIFADEYYCEGGDVEIYFNMDTSENTYENCGIYTMRLGRLSLDTEIMYESTLGEVFDLGYWSLNLNCYEIKSILFMEDLYNFFDTYGYPNAIYGTEVYYEDSDTYYYDYIACYINEEFVLTLGITELSTKDAEYSTMIIDEIRYFTPLAWDVECEYYGY